MVQLEKHASIETTLPDASAIAPERFAELAPLLLDTTNPPRR